MHFAAIFTLLGLPMTTNLAALMPWQALLHHPSATPLPDYVLKFAPLSYLYSEEAWWPSDVAAHLKHVVPKDGFTPVASSVTFANISSLGGNIYLTSKDDPFARPQALWMRGNGPPDASGYSPAPATIVAVQKPDGIVDAFYFYFYSYNHMHYFDITFGDHVGDWEHAMVRFEDGVPRVLYLSQHRGGIAYDFDAVPASDGRPLTYIAAGTHATFASPGRHQHDFPGLYDHADNGFLWDVTKHFRGFWFDRDTQEFRPAGGAGPCANDEMAKDVRWLAFQGKWGDKQYRRFENGQYCIVIPGYVASCKLTDGPTGPIDKNLGRSAPCQIEDGCVVHSSI